MILVGEEFLWTCLSQSGYFLKLVISEQIAHFFPYEIEHRDGSLPGLRYRDDSAGNALAATIKPTQIDIRLHSGFSKERIRAIAAKLENTLRAPTNNIRFDVNYGGEFVTSIKLAGGQRQNPNDGV